MTSAVDEYKRGLRNQPDLMVVDGRIVKVDGIDFIRETYPLNSRHMALNGTKKLTAVEEKVLASAKLAFGIEFISIERTENPTIWKAVMLGGGYYPIDVFALDDKNLLIELGLVEPEEPSEDLLQGGRTDADA